MPLGNDCMVLAINTSTQTSAGKGIQVRGRMDLEQSFPQKNRLVDKADFTGMGDGFAVIDKQAR